MPETSLPMCTFLSKITSIWSFESWVRHMRKESVWLIYYFSEPLTQGVLEIWCRLSACYLFVTQFSHRIPFRPPILSLSINSEFFFVSLSLATKRWGAHTVCHVLIGSRLLPQFLKTLLWNFNSVSAQPHSHHFTPPSEFLLIWNSSMCLCCQYCLDFMLLACKTVIVLSRIWWRY